MIHSRGHKDNWRPSSIRAREMGIPSSSPSSCSDCGSRLSAGVCPSCAFGLLLSPGELPEPKQVERYELRQRLAIGGMGVVYVAEDRKLKRTVALKMVRGSSFANEGELARFKLEAETAAALDHPNIVPIYEVGVMDDQPYFTMKLIEGKSLAERLAEGPLDEREAVTLLSEIARAVHHAHQRGVLHRDLKPGNILIDGDAKPWLTDFGLAKFTDTDSNLTLSGDHLGTPHYMSPEVAGGGIRHVSTATDVWALGVILWEMLVGKPPFQGDGPAEIMRRIVEDEPAWTGGSKSSPDLVTLARRCMEKKPERRLESAGELADELDRWLRGEPIQARPVTQQERLLKWMRRNPSLAALYAALLVGALSSLVLWQRAERAVTRLSESNEQLGQSLRAATATKLAGDARWQVSEDPNRALLLAVESVRLTESSGVLPEAASSLMGVLSEVGGLDASPGGLLASYQEAYVKFEPFHRDSARFSPDGRWLLCLDRSYWAEKPTPAVIHDMRDSSRDQPLRRWQIWEPGESVEAFTTCWLPDSRRLLSVDGLGRVRLVTVITDAMASGQMEPTTPSYVELGTLPLRPESNLLITRVWATEREMGAVWLERSRSPNTTPKFRIGRVRITPEGLEQQLDFLPIREAVPKFSPEGRWASFYLGDGKESATLLDLSGTTAIQHQLTLPSHFVDEVVFDGTERHIAVRLPDNSVYHGILPKPGSPSGQISFRQVATSPTPVRRIALSPEGRWLALTGDSSEVQIFPLDEERPFAFRYRLEGHGWSVNFSPDGQWLAASGKGRVVHLWPMEGIGTSVPPVLLRGMPCTVGEVIFTPDNTGVVAIGSGFAVHRWHFDGVSGAVMPRHLLAGGLSISESAVSPDGQWAAAACDAVGVNPPLPHATMDGLLVLSKLDGTRRLVLGNFGNRASGVAFSQDGRWLAGAGNDATVRIWDFAEATRCALEGKAAPEPRHVITVPGIRPHFRWVITFHPDGRLFMVNGDGVLFCWDANAPDPAATQRRQLIHSIAYILPDVAISPDGRFLAAARHAWDKKQPGQDQYGAQVLLYDVSDRNAWPPKFIAGLPSYFLEYTQLAFSPDNRWLAAGNAGFQPSLWDLHAPDISASVIRPPVLSHLISGVSFSPDSQWLAIGAGDGQLHFWKWRNGTELRSLQTDAGILQTTWMPDGRLLASGLSNTLTLWDTDIPRLTKLARLTAGRELSHDEKVRFRVP